VERSSVHLFSPDKNQLLTMSSLVVPGVQPYTNAVTKDLLPWYFERVYYGETLVLPRLPDDLPGDLPKERGYCLESGLKSYVCVPLAVAGEVLGTLTMEFFTHHVDWPRYLIRRLRLVGEIFANALIRQKNEENLRQAELRYRIVADFTYDWEYWENPDGSLNYVSPACERLSGYAVAEFLARPALLRELIVPEDREIWDQHKAQIQLDHHLGHPAIQFRMRRKDSDIRWLEHVCQPVYGGQGEFLGFRASNRDITGRKQTEIKEQQQRDELAHVMRVATLGELTASLAHEFNQPLSALLNNAQAGLRFLNREQPDLAEVTAALQDIVRDGKRANAVIQRLRGFLKPGLRRQEAVEVNGIVKEAVALLENDLRTRHITMHLHLAPDLPMAQGDHIQLQQVVLNLLLNSLEASQGAGPGQEIHLTTALANTDHLAVSVQDNGKGLQPEEVEKIFEPFYSQKNEGMGLGLSISRSIIVAHGGKLWASQNPEGGATLTFTLPRYQEETP
jgi:PAS domain S-box-containing protein